MTLLEAADSIGAGVVYAPKYGEKEDGTIIRVSGPYVMVRYDRGDPKATRPGDLELLENTSRSD